jgi:hypothetical protein
VGASETVSFGVPIGLLDGGRGIRVKPSGQDATPSIPLQGLTYITNHSFTIDKRELTISLTLFFLCGYAVTSDGVSLPC